MTRSEWIEIVAEMRVRWPHSEIPKQSIALWFDDLAQLPAEQVRVAAQALYRDGREFVPNSGQILAKVGELGRDDVDHGEAWRLVNDALWKHAPYDWDAFYAALPAPVAEAARRYGFETQGGYLKAEEGTVRAQFRDIYRAVVAEGKRDDAYAGLPHAGLRGLERGPRRLGDALRRALPAGGPS
jgi:hypothetical protein